MEPLVSLREMFSYQYGVQLIPTANTGAIARSQARAQTLLKALTLGPNPKLNLMAFPFNRYAIPQILNLPTKDQI